MVQNIENLRPELQIHTLSDSELLEQGRVHVEQAGTDERPWGLIFKPDSDERASLIGDERFYSPPYFGPSGWLALDLEAAPVDWDEVRELADSSYRQVALKRMLRALDG